MAGARAPLSAVGRRVGHILQQHAHACVQCAAEKHNGNAYWHGHRTCRARRRASRANSGSSPGSPVFHLFPACICHTVRRSGKRARVRTIGRHRRDGPASHAADAREAATAARRAPSRGRAPIHQRVYCRQQRLRLHAVVRRGVRVRATAAAAGRRRRLCGCRVSHAGGGGGGGGRGKAAHCSPTHVVRDDAGRVNACAARARAGPLPGDARHDPLHVSVAPRSAGGDKSSGRGRGCGCGRRRWRRLAHAAEGLVANWAHLVHLRTRAIRGGGMCV